MSHTQTSNYEDAQIVALLASLNEPDHTPSRSQLSQRPRTPDDSPDYEDAEILALISSFNDAALDEPASHPRVFPVPPSPPPRTPSRRLPPVTLQLQSHTFPANRPHTSPSRTPILYRYDTPTGREYTTDWASTGSATQGVAGTQVQIVSGSRKKDRSRKAAYVVFCGRKFGVFLKWDDVQAHVSGVSNAIYHGYKSLSEAQATFDYAVARAWVRNCYAPLVAAIPRLPTPASSLDTLNPLSGSQARNHKWYVVYRGITPGVYRSYLKVQLNTLGIQGSLHESLPSRTEALEKYPRACAQGEVAEVPPPYPDDVFS
ncbi:hypothetical protein DFH07DRAFT_955417 [Mycena maculata]|uniref:Ribonuclease H1 N-terminal domain-containing protein n=1 Tax=Mycena maculata TaxID=230809 RepID=A0AAD7JJU3_9AGAR|nr:hypothetical protein DFH07DRAFT_955417 [Mycena maculata]